MQNQDHRVAVRVRSSQKSDCGGYNGTMELLKISDRIVNLPSATI